MLGCSEIDIEVLDVGMETMRSDNYREVLKMMEIPIVYWLQCKREQDFPAKMSKSLSIYLPSQSVNCVR